MVQKFTLIATLFACISLTSKSQIEKGNVLVGGNLAFNSTTRDPAGLSGPTSGLSISPSVAWACKNNRLAGVLLTYRHTGNENKELNTNSYGAGVFLRQYKPLGKSGFYVFAQESLNYNNNEYRQFVSGYSGSYILKSKADDISTGINPGFAFDLTNKVQLELLLNNLVSLGYSQTKSSSIFNTNGIPSFSYKEHSFYINSDFNLDQLSNINVGVKFILGKK